MTRGEEPRSPATVIDLEPRRLREGEGPAAAAARAFHAETGVPPIDQATAWPRLALRLRRKAGTGRQRWRWVVAATLLAGGGVAAALLLAPGRHRAERRGSTVVVAPQPPASHPIATMPPKATPPMAPVVPPTTAAAPSVRRARVALSASPHQVPVGAVDLGGEARVDLAAGGRAVASTDAGSTRVALSRGSLRLDVNPREPGRRFQVEAGPYRFVVVGTSFRVLRSPRAVELWVFEGHVAVWRAEHLGPMVGAGEHWSGSLPAGAVLASLDAAPTGTSATAPAVEPPPAVAPRPPTPAVELPVPRRVRSEALSPCEAAAGAGRSGEALDCYRRIGQGADLAAELALYEAARLELRLSGDVRATLDMLAAHTRRFPQGALRSEVDLTRVELLPRIGEHRRALEESERILREHPGHERWRELRLLRGNIFREALGDCRQAEAEYQAAADGTSRVADDADFYRAVCIELVGRRGEAAGAYRDYLGRPRPAHQAEAQKRLSSLQP